MKFRVNSVAFQPIEKIVTLDGGQQVPAIINGLVVEMLEVDGTNTFTLRYIPEDMVAAQELYYQDAIIEVSFNPVDEE